MSSATSCPASALALNADIINCSAGITKFMGAVYQNAFDETMSITDNKNAVECLRTVALLLEKQIELAGGASSSSPAHKDSVKTANKEVQVQKVIKTANGITVHNNFFHCGNVDANDMERILEKMIEKSSSSLHTLSTDIAVDEAAKKAAEEEKNNDIETRLLRTMGKMLDEKFANAAETRKKEEADKKAAKKASQAKRQRLCRERSSSECSSSFDPAEFEEQRRKTGTFGVAVLAAAPKRHQPSSSSHVASPTAALPTGAQISKRTGTSSRRGPPPPILDASDILRGSYAPTRNQFKMLQSLAAGTSGDSSSQLSTGKPRKGSTNRSVSEK